MTWGAQQKQQKPKQEYKLPDDYNDVASRITEFRAKHPEGSLRPANPLEPFRIETVEGQTFIVVVAAAYRYPDDPAPGIGSAWEQFPGRTPYTRNSELQNAETSAWGRAIVATGAADTKKGIASSEEVRNRAAEQDDPLPDAQLTTEQVQRQIIVIGRAKGDDRDIIADGYRDLYGHLITAATVEQLVEFRDKYRENGLRALLASKGAP